MTSSRQWQHQTDSTPARYELQVGARGVHLGQQDSSITEARNLLGADSIIGVTCHDSVEQALRAQDEGADYVAFGRFFPSRTKPDAPPADIAVLTTARQQLDIPTVAIGGVNADNGALLRDAGADMLAVIDGLFGRDDVGAAATELVRLFSTNE